MPYLKILGTLLLMRFGRPLKTFGILALCVVGVVVIGRRGDQASAVGTALLPAEDDMHAARASVPAPAPTPRVDSTEVLWLARAIYSETKLPHEQELVAWVIRNRVETGYRGEQTYKGVVLDPWQFSAFNSNSPKRRYYSSLKYESAPAGFQTALEIAARVAHAPDAQRPFAENTRHFYSERSMRGRRAPGWAVNKTPVRLDRKVDPRRFRFYAGIS